MDGPGIFEFAQYTIIRTWEVLERVVKIQRKSMNNPYMWATADYLYESTKTWMNENAKERQIVNPQTGELFQVDQML